jgi:hypothetical protein
MYLESNITDTGAISKYKRSSSQNSYKRNFLLHSHTNLVIVLSYIQIYYKFYITQK